MLHMITTQQNDTSLHDNECQTGELDAANLW